mmetsp:Transcript_19826/g.41557  ORF Transcript_19826/g.41557 Transcript_19826/m.41557 type:complete len:84 (+) Transcript_19826:236-487(+)
MHPSQRLQKQWHKKGIKQRLGNERLAQVHFAGLVKQIPHFSRIASMLLNLSRRSTPSFVSLTMASLDVPSSAFNVEISFASSS